MTRAQSTLLFLCLALGFTWVLQAPALLAKHGWLPGAVESYLLPAAIGGFGPLLAALLAARLERSAAGGRGRLNALLPKGVGAGWYVLSLALFPALYAASVAILFFGRTCVVRASS
jgi:hypothetical protein